MKPEAQYAYRALVEYEGYDGWKWRAYGIFQTAGAARRAGGGDARGRRVRIQRTPFAWEDIE